MNATLAIDTAEAKAMDRRRGHRFTPPKAVLAKVPDLYDTEGVDLDDKVVHVHYFTGSADWYVVELNQETGEAFGYADLGFGCGEWGYFDLVELATVRAGYLGVERDMHWTPGRFADVRR